MIPREVEEALGDYSDAWSDGDDNIDAFRAALVAAIERAIEAATRRERRDIIFMLPGGTHCDPQEVADAIRARD